MKRCRVVPTSGTTAASWQHTPGSTAPATIPSPTARPRHVRWCHSALRPCGSKFVTCLEADSSDVPSGDRTAKSGHSHVARCDSPRPAPCRGPPLRPKQHWPSLPKRRHNRRSCVASQLNTPAFVRPSLIRRTSSCRLKGCRPMCSANV